MVRPRQEFFNVSDLAVSMVLQGNVPGGKTVTVGIESP